MQDLKMSFSSKEHKPAVATEDFVKMKVGEFADLVFQLREESQRYKTAFGEIYDAKKYAGSFQSHETTVYEMAEIARMALLTGE